jgi:phosphate transport system substrate-binding protein
MTIHRIRCLEILIVLAIFAEACNGAPASPPPASPGTPTSDVSGRVKIDGSSTVVPVTKRVVEAFRQEHPRVEVSVENSGTGAGFKKFCAGETDINDASRPINQDESGACTSNKVDFVELPFAFDSIAVVVNPQSTFVDCLTVPELRAIWEPSADGRVTRWSQVRPGFPDRPITLFGPGRASGTFDYFTLAVVGKESSSRSDYTKSEDDSVSATGADVLVDGIARDANALGYFGYSYYAANKDKLRLVAVDGGAGCVAPSAASVAENRYQPLTRPMFVYIKTASLARPEVSALAQFYVAPESARFSLEAGYMPLPTVTLLSVGRRLDQGVTGSVFGGHGSVLGVTVAAFDDEDKIKSALVQ